MSWGAVWKFCYSSKTGWLRWLREGCVTYSSKKNLISSERLGFRPPSHPPTDLSNFASKTPLDLCFFFPFFLFVWWHKNTRNQAAEHPVRQRATWGHTCNLEPCLKCGSQHRRPMRHVERERKRGAKCAKMWREKKIWSKFAMTNGRKKKVSEQTLI